jgi:hypothetical protein
METENAIEPVTTEEDTNIPFSIGVGKVFVVGAALGAGVYAGKLLVDWVAMKIVFRRNGPTAIPPQEDN